MEKKQRAFASYFSSKSFLLLDLTQIDLEPFFFQGLADST